MRVQIIASLLSVAVVGCVSASPTVETRVAGPIAPATFRVSEPPESEAADGGVERQVASVLVEKGLSPAGAGQVADYSVEVAYAERPNGVGAAAPQAQGPATPLVAPQRRSLTRPLVRGAGALTVRILETRSGRELYAVSVTRPYRKASPDLAPGLVDAALTPLWIDGALGADLTVTPRPPGSGDFRNHDASRLAPPAG